MEPQKGANMYFGKIVRWAKVQYGGMESGSVYLKMSIVQRIEM